MADKLDDPRMEKLPKWAQHLIAKLEGDNAYYKGKLEVMDAGTSDVRIRDMLNGDTQLPPGSTIRFTLPCGGYIDARVVDDALELLSERDPLTLECKASNTILAR